MPRSKTIQIFLKNADPNDIRIARLSVSTAKVYVIPRDKISFVASRKELHTPALYMLFDEEKTSVYIGECENFSHRIKSHEINKDFWQWAVVAIASDHSLDKADVKFLESYALNKAIEMGRLNIVNRNSPNQNNLHEFKQEAVLDFFDDVELLISTLGFDVFTPLQSTLAPQPPQKPTSSSHSNLRNYDTIVCPSTGDGFQQAFVKAKAWWAVRISRSNLKKLKYIAIYESAPVSAIRYYAKIKKIESYQDEPGKYIIYHDGDIKKFPNPIVLGDTPQLALYGPRYYLLKDMQTSSTLAELTNKTFKTN